MCVGSKTVATDFCALVLRARGGSLFISPVFGNKVASIVDVGLL